MINEKGIAIPIQARIDCVWSMPPNGMERVKNAMSTVV